jgi:hypothetical protein
MQTINFRLEKGLLGDYTVFYPCPHCRVDLSSPLQEAGSKQRGPHCQGEFVVPAVEKRREEDARKREQAEQAARTAAAQKQLREATALRKIEAEANAKLQANLRKRSREQESNGFPTPVGIPDYWGIKLGSGVLRWMGFCYLVIAGVAVFLAFYFAATIKHGDSGSDIVGGLTFGGFIEIGIGFFTVGAIILMISSLADAIRDMARNSWRPYV